MNITEFAPTHRAGFKRPKAEIVKRWNERVVSRGLHTQGRLGAAAYLTAYGKGISSPKVIELALMAESEGAVELAAGFWEKAFELAEGRFEPFGPSSEGGVASVRIETARSLAAPSLPSLPAELQPSKVGTMQPKDAPKPREHYITNPAFWGERKRDGHRTVLFATLDRVVHQSRSTNIRPTFDLRFDAAVQAAVAKVGGFVVDSEIYYLSARGSEHRTAAQAATQNVKDGCGQIAPVPCLAIFKALYANGQDLRGGTEAERIEAAMPITAALSEALADLPALKVEQLLPARTESEKRTLCETQAAEGREGEVWVRHACAYTAGDASPQDFVRTKYLKEEEFLVQAVVKSDAVGRLVASIAVVTNDAERTPVGSVGSGFDAADAAKLLRLHETKPGEMLVKIRFQGYTEGGQLMHPRFLDFV